MDAQRFLGELVAGEDVSGQKLGPNFRNLLDFFLFEGFSVFLPRDYHLIGTRVKVQKHKHGRAIVVPPFSELMRALVVFLSVRASSTPDHLTFVTQSVAGAVMTMLDTLQEPDFDEVVFS